MEMPPVMLDEYPNYIDWSVLVGRTSQPAVMLTDSAVMFLMIVLGTVPTPDHVGLLNRRLSLD